MSLRSAGLPVFFVAVSLLGFASPVPASRAGVAESDGLGSPLQAANRIDLATYPGTRWIIQLADPPVAGYTGGVASLAPTAIGVTGERRLDLGAPAARAYRAHLLRAQHAFEAVLRKVAPDSRVDRAYTVVVNGLGVRMSPPEAGVVRALPGVRAVTPDVPVTPAMFATPSQIGALPLWERLGGQAAAGRGVKVAIIDGGIYVRSDDEGRYAGNPCFAADGYEMPDGFPKGDTHFTNAKVIVARAYFRPDDPPVAGSDSPLPGTSSGDTPHGTHVAGTVACRQDTAATYDGVPVALSGVAPGAWLMNYKVFYASSTSDRHQQGNGYVIEVVAALEDAVEDGADVISNSWGASYQNTLAWPDPMVQAAEMAVGAGVVAVFAAGNEGGSNGTVVAPGIAPSVITVGSVTKSAAASAGDLDIVGPEPVPDGLARVDVAGASFGPEDVQVFPPDGAPSALVVWAGSVTADGSDTGCSVQDASPFPDGSLAGKVALLQAGRGRCTFPEQVVNAERAGAVAAVVYNEPASGDSLATMGSVRNPPEITIPSWLVRRSDGLALQGFVTTHPDATVRYAARAHIAPVAGDRMAGSSSRGPTQDELIKPDVTAPGVDILSSGYGPRGDAPDATLTGFGAVSGTSMATPHVAGAAALLVALHPDWRPNRIKAALMGTATESVFLDTAQTVRAGVLDRGAGRIDVGAAADPGVLLDPPSLSVGEVEPGAGVTRTLALTVTVSDVGLPGQWHIAVDRPGGEVDGSAVHIAPVMRSVSVPPGGTAAVVVTVAVAADAQPGNYEGTLRLTHAETGRTVHAPVWVRVVPPRTVDVLVLDDDRSSAEESLTDYVAAYTSTLEILELTYDYVDLHASRLPTIADLSRHRAALLFTGDNAEMPNGRSGSGLDGSERDRLTEWLDDGGRILATGQNLAETQGSAYGLYGNRFYKGYLSLTVAVTDTFGGPAPSPSAEGRGPFAGLTLDLGPDGGGAGNQISVEATRAMTDTDTYAGQPWMTPLFAPIGGTAPADAAVGWGRSSDPSLEEPRTGADYRAISLGFGLEGLASGEGPSDRTAVLGRAMDWLLDEGEVSLDVAGPAVSTDTVLRADYAFQLGTRAVRLRWDFGDGSPYASTDPAVDGLATSHRYASPGTYIARVEVTSALGHRVIGDSAVHVGDAVYLPSLSRASALR